MGVRNFISKNGKTIFEASIILAMSSYMVHLDNKLDRIAEAIGLEDTMGTYQEVNVQKDSVQVEVVTAEETKKEKFKPKPLSIDSDVLDSMRDAFSLDSNIKPVPLNREIFSESLSEAELRNKVAELKKELGAWAFPVNVSNRDKENALEIGESYFEFGGERGFGKRKHKGVDFYGYGKPIFSFYDGTIEKIGRFIATKSKSDFGNTILINHGFHSGKLFYSMYMHWGNLENGLKEGDSVKKGQKLALTDCTGIPVDSRKRNINPGSKLCKEKAHLHFQLIYGDYAISPIPFFSKYAKHSLKDLEGKRLAIKMSEDISDNIQVSSKPWQTTDSFTKPGEKAKSTNFVVEVANWYDKCADLYHAATDTSVRDSAKTCFEGLIAEYEGKKGVRAKIRDAKLSVNHLDTLSFVKEPEDLDF